MHAGISASKAGFICGSVAKKRERTKCLSPRCPGPSPKGLFEFSRVWFGRGIERLETRMSAQFRTSPESKIPMKANRYKITHSARPGGTYCGSGGRIPPLPGTGKISSIMKNELSDLLKAWQPDVPQPADFRRGVWSKIEARSSSPGWLAQLLSAIGRPRIAVALAAVAILAGGISGNLMSRDAHEDAYLRSVNPYAMAR